MIFVFSRRILLTAVSVLFASCSLEDGMTPLVDMEAPAELNLDLNRVESVLEIGWADDRNTLKYYVFDLDTGNLEYVSSSNDIAGTSLKIKKGEKEIWAVTGMDFSRFDLCRNLDDLKKTELNLEECTGSDNCPMSGKVGVRVYSSSKVSASLSLYRFTSRIRIREIRNFLSAPLAGLPITIRGIFMTNALANCTVSGECAGSKRIIKDRITGLTSLSYEKECQYGESVYPDLSLMFLPYSDDPVTILVMEAMIGDERFYYPVKLSGTQRNHTYDLVLEITRPGSSSPDSFEFGRAGQFSIDIQEFHTLSDEITIIF